MKKFFQQTISTEKRNFHNLKKEMGISHQKSKKYVPDKYQKKSSLPLLDHTKFTSFREER
jgi:hypothetical protein